MCTSLPQSPCFRNLTVQNLTESIVMYSWQLHVPLYNTITHMTGACHLCPPQWWGHTWRHFVGQWKKWFSSSPLITLLSRKQSQDSWQRLCWLSLTTLPSLILLTEKIKVPRMCLRSTLPHLAFIQGITKPATAWRSGTLRVTLLCTALISPIYKMWQRRKCCPEQWLTTSIPSLL